MAIRPMTGKDLRQVWEINEANEADVGSLAVDDLAVLVEDSAIGLVAVADSSVVGFGIAVDETARYRTEGMRWAWRHNPRGLHLDRVAFDMSFSGRGLGPALYDEIDAQVAERCGDGELALTSVVRVEPPNRHAIDFHASRGFEEVERATIGGNRMALLRKVYRS